MCCAAHVQRIGFIACKGNGRIAVCWAFACLCSNCQHASTPPHMADAALKVVQAVKNEQKAKEVATAVDAVSEAARSIGTAQEDASAISGAALQAAAALSSLNGTANNSSSLHQAGNHCSAPVDLPLKHWQKGVGTTRRFH